MDRKVVLGLAQTLHCVLLTWSTICHRSFWELNLYIAGFCDLLHIGPLGSHHGSVELLENLTLNLDLGFL